MRNNELSEGIVVVDKDDNVVGTSVIAAEKVNYLIIYNLDWEGHISTGIIMVNPP